MITMLLATTVFHQVLVVELPADGRTPLRAADARHRILDAAEARALADSLEGAGATLLAAPSLLSAEGEGAELHVETATRSFDLEVQEWRGSTRIELEVRDGHERVAHVRARFVIPDGGTFLLPIDERHLLIARQDVLADGESITAPAGEWKTSWAGLLRE